MANSANPASPSRCRPRHANALGSDCMLDEYRIDSILGAGGFGVTYKAWDTHLQNWVAIKEYFPVAWSFRDPDGVTVHPNTQGVRINDKGDQQISDYLWGLERFLDEARVLARIQHPYVVRVKRYFRAHGTAYIVMDYEEGEPLNAILQDGDTLREDEVRGLLEDVLPALRAVHEQGYLHRDIKPSNLYIRASDHRVILLDFGAAREAIGRHGKSMTSMVTPGYSPPEQYTTRNERYGPWTDIYALGAVLYRCVTGHPPLEATERLLDDRMEPAIRVCAGRYGANLLQVIDRALAMRAEQRFQAVTDMQAALSDQRDEDSEETVILGPWVKPGGKPIPKLDTSPATQPSSTSTMEEPALDKIPPIITQAAVAGGQPDGEWRETLQPSWNLGASGQRRTLVALFGGGLVLAMIAAAATVWFWPGPPTPEETPPPRHTLSQWEQPTATPDTNPPISARSPAPTTTPTPPSPAPMPDAMVSGTPSGAPSAMAEPATPLPTSMAVLPPPLEEPPVVETAPPESSAVLEPTTPPQSAAEDTKPTPPLESGESAAQISPTQTPLQSGESAAQINPDQTSATGTASELAVGTRGRLPMPKAMPIAKPSTPARSSPASRTDVTSPTATKSRNRSSSASSVQSKPARRQANKTRARARPSVTQPAIRVIERKPVSTTTVHNPWEPPTSTGFNQK